MSGQIRHLVRMANQIAHNMAVYGDGDTVAAKTAEHLEKFWTPAMRRQLQAFWQGGGEDLAPALLAVLESRDWSAEAVED